MPRSLPNLTGQEFGKLTVVGTAWKHNRTFWKCTCTCGNTTLVLTHSLVKGLVRSCGCLKSTNEGRPSSWSGTELELLKSTYGKLPYTEVYALFPGRNPRSIKSKALALGIALDRKDSKQLFEMRDYTHNDSAFGTLTLESAYWAGFIAADGNVAHKPYYRLSVGLKSTDRAHLEKFRTFLEYTGVIGERAIGSGKSNGKCYTQTYMHINSCAQLCLDLEKYYNVVPNKSLILLPPNINDPLPLKAYLVGLIDGDGCIYTNRNKLAFNVIGSQHVINWVKSYLCSYFPELSAISVTSRGSIYAFFVTNRKAEKVLNWLLDIDVPRLERKWNKVKEYTPNV